MIEKKLEEMRKKLETAQRLKDQSEGKLEAAMEELEREFGCKTVDQAVKKAAQLEKEIAKERDALDKAVQALEDGYDWDD